MKFLLDTNVFREIGKTRPDANVAGWLDTVDDAALAISALTVREVRKGIIRLHVRKPAVADQIEMRVRQVFDAFRERILPVTREVADLWGELLAHSGKHVDDTGLVATARVYGLTLVTRNLRHVSGRGATTPGSIQIAAENHQAVTYRRRETSTLASSLQRHRNSSVGHGTSGRSHAKGHEYLSPDFPGYSAATE